MRVAILTAMLVLGAIRLLGQCVQQPPPPLKNVSEFACRSMSYEEAWEAMTEAGVQPIRPERVAQLATKRNTFSRKNLLKWTLRGIAIGLSSASGHFAIEEKLWKGVLAAAPLYTEAGIKLVEGFPDPFVQLPDANGFITIYAVETGVAIVGRPDVTTPPRAAWGPYMNQAEQELLAGAR